MVSTAKVATPYLACGGLSVNGYERIAGEQKSAGPGKENALSQTSAVFFASAHCPRASHRLHLILTFLIANKVAILR